MYFFAPFIIIATEVLEQFVIEFQVSNLFIDLCADSQFLVEVSDSYHFLEVERWIFIDFPEHKIFLTLFT